MRKKQGLALFLVLVLLMANLTGLSALAADPTYSLRITTDAKDVKKGDVITIAVTPDITGDGQLHQYSGVLQYAKGALTHIGEAMQSGAPSGWSVSVSPYDNVKGGLPFLVENLLIPAADKIGFTITFAVAAEPSANAIEITAAELSGTDDEPEEVTVLLTGDDCEITFDTTEIPTRTLTIAKNLAGAEVKVKVGDAAAVTTATVEEIPVGEWVEVTAVENGSYSFVGWTADGITAGNSATFGFFMPAVADPAVEPDLGVTLTADFRGTVKRAVTVTATGGTVTGATSYLEGDEVTLTARANTGFEFKGWEVTGGGVELTSEPADTAKFTMPGIEVEITANFVSKRPVLTSTSHNRTSDTAATLTFTSDKTGTAYYVVKEQGAAPPESRVAIKQANQSLGEVSDGQNTKTIALTAGAKDVYLVVAGDASDDSLSVAHVFNIDAYSPGGNNTGPGTIIEDNEEDEKPGTTEPDPEKGITVEVEAEITQNEETGAVTAAVSEESITKAFDTEEKVGEIAVNIPESDTVTPDTPIEVAVAKEAFAIIAENNAALTISAPALSMSFDSDAVSTIAESGDGDVVISAGLADTEAMTEEQLDAAGDRPVYSFAVTNGDNKVTDLGGRALITIPYTLRPGEDPNAIIICYIDSNGVLQTIPGGVYNAATGRITFAVTHFSLYMIDYKFVEFLDTAESWAIDHITFVAARELFSGVGGGMFSPNGKMSRAMFAQVLANLEKADLSGYTSSRFTDVTDGAWYIGAVEWAAERDIITGVGDNKFAPDTNITREQMAVMLNRYITYKNSVLPVTAEKLEFGDESQISSWAKAAVEAIQRAGIIDGKTGGIFDPAGDATRAEVSKVFAKFIETLAR